MSNQPKDTPIATEASDAPAEPPDAEPDYDDGAHDNPSGTSTSDLPNATDGELPPAP